MVNGNRRSEAARSEATKSGVTIEYNDSTVTFTMPINSSNDIWGFSSGDAMLGAESAGSSNGQPNQRYVPVRSGRTCCSEHRRRISYGFFLTSFIATSWVGGTHLLKAMEVDYAQALAANAQLNLTHMHMGNKGDEDQERPTPMVHPLYHAPFFTTWFCTTFNAFFYPVYLTSKLCAPASESPSLKKELVDSVQPYQEKGLSAGRFLCRCGIFTTLWVISNYLLVRSLSLLDATDVISLYATSVAFTYLLSWVLLQEQFVGIRIVAVIICNTAIALFAYMDRASRSSTLGGVVLAASASAGTAVQKVLFKKYIGEVNFAQMSLFFTFVGLCNALLAWPFVVALWLTGLEIIQWEHLPWLPLLGAALFIFFANLLGNFGVLWTYEVFLTLGLVLAVPASAVVDVYLYSIIFKGMKLGGVILTIIGFLFVLLPENWPEYLTFFLTLHRKKFAAPENASVCNSQGSGRAAYASRLRTHSGRVK